MVRVPMKIHGTYPESTGTCLGICMYVVRQSTQPSCISTVTAHSKQLTIAAVHAHCKSSLRERWLSRSCDESINLINFIDRNAHEFDTLELLGDNVAWMYTSNAGPHSQAYILLWEIIHLHCSVQLGALERHPHISVAVLRLNVKN